MLFPTLELDDFFVNGTYAFGLAKSLGTITPIDTDNVHPLHRNWATNPCVRFQVHKLKLIEFIKLLSKYNFKEFINF